MLNKRQQQHILSRNVVSPMLLLAHSMGLCEKKKKKDSYSELKSNSEDLDSEYEVTSSLSLFHFLFCGHKNDIKTFKF